MQSPPTSMRALCAALTVLAACDATAPIPHAATLRLSADSVVVFVDSVAHIEAAVLADDGRVLSGEPVAWVTWDTTVATVRGGAVSGVAVGATELMVAAGAALRRIPVRVVVRLAAVAPGTLSCALSTDRHPYCWGLSRGTPALVPGGFVFDTVATSDLQACGLDAAGRAACWGRTSHPDGTSDSSDVPVAVPGDHRFRQLAMSAIGLVCGLTDAGETWCWGTNYYSVVPTTDPWLAAPTRTATAYAFTALALGHGNICALTSAGLTYCWGLGESGETGDDNPADYCGIRRCNLAPRQMAGLPVLRSLAANSYQTCGLTPEGEAWCWGANWFGQLGDSASATGCRYATVRGLDPYECSAQPVRVGGGHRFQALALGVEHTCGITADGAAWCWGANDQGEYGAGQVSAGGFEPVRGGGSLVFTRLAAGHGFTCGVAPDQRTWCWGDDWYNSLGNGDRRNDDSAVPVVVAGQP